MVEQEAVNFKAIGSSPILPAMRKAGTSKVYSISNIEFIDLVKRSNSYSDVLRALGLTTRGGSSQDIVKRRITKLGCDTSHFGDVSIKSPTQVHSIEDILVENSSYANIASLKRRIINNKLLKYECSKCGISSWNDQPLSLHLDHINGINNDHRLENLRFLCPNCHSQTDTYAGKNKKK